MSGSQGSPRLGRCKIRLRVLKVGTAQRFATNIFLPAIKGSLDIGIYAKISEKIAKKYPDLDLAITKFTIVSSRPKESL